MGRHKPKKHKSPLKAIREFCIECVGGRENEGHLKFIENCGSPECAVFDFRFGNNPYHTQNLTVEQRQERSERAKLVAPYKKRSKKAS
jgi:hypothetical protein